ncbi:MAG: bifunctional adenosylcobinamide kinase/adenosylcobinamide-phosphate guanylyltransferase [Dehalococcoidia bacterium]|nr:bifunctional adenosylcobinamide kinase/adenosylcobinamide-phosphate guanylyltransferase [Dehalococcoidia bacterium]MDZ4245560.1 bifunctional adenosylcobinamide kinase/adenosylcobinamide-phosphate guanylyltransferase [Dehalococcoidia bacterium]
MNSRCIFILGGSRSGKSAYAEKLAKQLAGQVLFIATAEAGDEEMAKRIAAHRKNRPKSWRTLEAAGNIGKQIEKKAGEAGIIIIDCLTLMVSNLMSVTTDSGDEAENRKTVLRVKRELRGLLKCMEKVDATFIIVSNEVGLGLVPPYPLGRLYRDLLGEVNQSVARRADEIYFMAAGIPFCMKGKRIERRQLSEDCL